METVYLTAEEWWNEMVDTPGAEPVRLADGRNYVIDVDESWPYRLYTLDGKENGSITVVGNGNGAAERAGRGDGHAVRDGTGIGAARRSGPGSGDAVRTGSGQGSAERDGDGRGDAERNGLGTGNASRLGSGDGDAWRAGTGCGKALRRGSGSGNAFHTGTGHGYAAREGAGSGYEEDKFGRRFSIAGPDICYPCTYGAGYLRVGCEIHSLADWIANAVEIDAKHGDGIAYYTHALAEDIMNKEVNKPKNQEAPCKSSS